MTLDEVSVLIVDDVNAMRVQLKSVLRAVGFSKITVASNGAEAKNIIRTQPVQLILCDWHMEPVNGLDLLQHVRTEYRFEEIGFIMVTAEYTKEKVIEAISAGVDDYLIKPISQEQIQNRTYATLLKRKVLG